MRRTGITALIAVVYAVGLSSQFTYGQQGPRLLIFGQDIAGDEPGECLQDAGEQFFSGLGITPELAGLMRARQLGFRATTWREIYDHSNGTHIRATRFRRNPNNCGGLEAVGNVIVIVRDGASAVTMRANRVTADWNCVPIADGLFQLANVQQSLWSIDGYCPQTDAADAINGDQRVVRVDDNLRVVADAFRLDSSTGTIEADGDVTIVVTRQDGYTITMRGDSLTVQPHLGRPGPGSFWDLRP